MNKIIIKGKEYPCEVTMGALVRFHKESGKEASGISSDNLSDLALFIWCCVASACNAAEPKIPFDMPFLDFADSLDVNAANGFWDGVSSDDKKKAPEVLNG